MTWRQYLHQHLTKFNILILFSGRFTRKSMSNVIRHDEYEKKEKCVYVCISDVSLIKGDVTCFGILSDLSEIQREHVNKDPWNQSRK